MPRYFFNVLEDRESVPDMEGSECPDLEAARLEAISAARELISEWAMKGELPLSFAFTVTDESGSVLFTIPFKDVVTVR